MSKSFTCTHGNPVRPGEPFTLDQCRVCWLAAGGDAKAPIRHKVAKVALPCIYIGEAAGPKGWHICDHPDEPLGMVVCACKGCGPRCPGYPQP